MKIKIIFSLNLLLLCFCSSCIKQGQYLFTANLTTKSTTTDYIETTSRMGMTVVPIVIKGKTQHFIFDTGAQTSIITKELAHKLSLKNVGVMNVHDSQGMASKLNFSTIDSIYIGERLFTQVGAVILDSGVVDYFNCIQVDGILGMNVMKLCNWQINYETNSMLIKHLDSSFATPNSIVSKFQMIKGSPIVNWFVGGKKTAFTLDTGKNAKEVGFASKGEVEKPIYQTVGVNSIGLHGKGNEDTTTTIRSSFSDSLNLNFENVVFEYSKKSDALIGNGFFEAYFSSIAFDFNRKEIAVIKRNDNALLQSYAYPFTPLMTGDLVVIGSKEIHTESIQVGDTIVKINHLDLSNSTVCDMMLEYTRALESHQNISIEIARKGVHQLLQFEAVKWD